jgi:hypothetical protein
MTYVFIAYMIDHFETILPLSRNEDERRYRSEQLFYYQQLFKQFNN